MDVSSRSEADLLSRNLARALAVRLSDVVPKPYTVQALGNRIEVPDPSGRTYARTYIDLFDEGAELPVEDLVRSAIGGILSHVQDVVSEYLARPWPVVGANQMAMPGARFDDRGFHLWYGDADAPVVRMPLITLAEVTRSE